MNESLNTYAANYAGLLGIISLVGFVLTVIFGILALYFYHNPRREKYRLRYKIFANDFYSVLLYFKAKSASQAGEEYLFDSYIDVWNAGQESVGPDVVRGPMQIFLEREATETGIRSVELVSDTTDGAGNFQVRQVDGKVELSWKHFDPSQAVRLRVMTNQPLRNRDIGLLSKGLRLSVGKSATDEGGWLRSAVMPVCVVAIVLFVGGFVAKISFGFLARFDFDSIWVLIFGFPVAVLAIMAVLGVPAALATGFISAFEKIVNVKSPVERLEGVPSVGVPTVISKQLYIDFLASLEPKELEMLMRRYQMETTSDPMMAVSFGGRSPVISDQAQPFSTDPGT